MAKLEGGTYFLVLSEHSEEEDRPSVKCYGAFKDVLTNHNEANIRVSPIFPLDGKPPPNFNSLKESYLLFTGPLFPGHLDLGFDADIYLSFGTYNIIIWCKNEDELRIVKKHSLDHKASCEVWYLDCEGILCNLEHELVESEELKHQPTLIEVGEELKISAREYSLLVTKSLHGAARYWKEQMVNMQKFDSGFKYVVDKQTDNLGKITSLALTNSALSQHYSQVYSGTSPITNNECYYATHSLLGVGLANQVLQRIRDFSSEAFTKFHYLKRISLLKRIPPKIINNESHLYSIALSCPFFEKEILGSEEVNQELEVYIKANDERKEALDTIPNITYFSDKEGFRSTRFSLTAPFETISGSNTYEWTLMTLTHEISHVYIDGVLGIFLPNPLDNAESNFNFSLLSGKEKASSFFEQGQDLLLFGLKNLYLESIDSDKSDSKNKKSIRMNKKLVQNFILYGSREANEILTHIFDYIYFYREDESLYIKCIWSSWAVIPNIETRVPEYIVRTLCAILVSRMSWNIEDSIDALNDKLSELKAMKPGKIPVLDRAIEELKDRQKYKLKLQNRVAFVKFVKAFLHSRMLSVSLQKGKGTVATSLGFRENSIKNPLRFLEEHAVEKSPQMLKSVWMIQHLAFTGDSHGK